MKGENGFYSTSTPKVTSKDSFFILVGIGVCGTLISQTGLRCVWDFGMYDTSNIRISFGCGWECFVSASGGECGNVTTA